MKVVGYGPSEDESPDGCLRWEVYRDGEFAFGVDVDEAQATQLHSSDDIAAMLDEAAEAARKLDFEYEPDV